MTNGLSIYIQSELDERAKRLPFKDKALAIGADKWPEATYLDVVILENGTTTGQDVLVFYIDGRIYQMTSGQFEMIAAALRGAQQRFKDEKRLN